MNCLRRAITPPRINDHRAGAAAHRDFRAHAVRPEAVDHAGLQGVRGRHTKILVLTQECARYRTDLDLVALDVDAGLDEQALEAEVDQWRGADVQTLDGADVALLRLEIGTQDQEPVHVLRERREELAAFPARKCRRHAVRGAADEIDTTIAQHFERPVDRKNQFQRHVEAFVLEKAEFDSRGGWKIRIGNHVRDGNFHGSALLERRGFRDTNVNLYRAAHNRSRNSAKVSPA